MKIRTRIATVSTISVSVVLLAVGAVIYVSAEISREKSFQNRLEERVEITEDLFLEKNNLSAEVYRDIREKFLHTLPDETEHAINLSELNQGPVDSGVPYDFVDQLGHESIEHTNIGRRQFAGKVYHVDGEDYAIIVTAVDEFGHEHIEDLGFTFLIGFLVSIPLIFLTSLLFAKQSLKPIARKIKNAQKISATSLHQRLQVYNEKDELGQLAIAFNNLLERLEASFELQKNFIQNASHEIRNPLASIIGETDVLLSIERSNKEYKEGLGSIAREADRINALVNCFLKTPSQENMLSSESLVHIDDLVFQTKLDLDKLVPENKIKFDLSNLPKDSTDLLVKGDKEMLQVVFSNLAENACKFSNNQEVFIKIESHDLKVLIEFIDLGVGIPTIESAQVFEPLYRGSNVIKDYRGSGIGLSLVARILQLHGGEIEVLPNKPQGTIMRVTLPIFREK